MAKEADPFEFGAVGKQAMEQIQGAMDNYFDNLKKMVSSAPSDGTEFGEKVKSYAEKNINAAHDFVKRLSQAKDWQDMFRIQSEYMQTQATAFGEQAKSLGEAFSKAAPGAFAKFTGKP